MTALSYGTIGWGGVVALAFTGTIANYIARKLALTRSKTNDLLQRLASLTNIGKTISLRYTTDELLKAIYTECKTVIDCSLLRHRPARGVEERAGLRAGDARRRRSCRRSASRSAKG